MVSMAIVFSFIYSMLICASLVFYDMHLFLFSLQSTTAYIETLNYTGPVPRHCPLFLPDSKGGCSSLSTIEIAEH